MNNDEAVGFYMVGILDILGQRRTLGQVPNDRLTPMDELEQAAKHLQDTVGVVKRLRTLFQENIENYARDQNTIAPEIVSWGMSDAYVFAVRLARPESDRAIANAMTDVLISLSTTAWVWLVSLAHGSPIRGGVEIGPGMAIGEHEVYGQALAAAYHLESQVAKGPRIVAGKRLVRFLADVYSRRQHQDPGVQEAARRAENCLALLQACSDVTDSDGKNDEGAVFLVDGFAMAKTIKLAREMFDKASDYVRRQVDVHVAAGDDKLASRYRSLLAHFERGLPDSGLVR